MRSPAELVQQALTVSTWVYSDWIPTLISLLNVRQTLAHQQFNEGHQVALRQLCSMPFPTWEAIQASWRSISAWENGNCKCKRVYFFALQLIYLQALYQILNQTDLRTYPLKFVCIAFNVPVMAWRQTAPLSNVCNSLGAFCNLHRLRNIPNVTFNSSSRKITAFLWHRYAHDMIEQH